MTKFAVAVLNAVDEVLISRSAVQKVSTTLAHKICLTGQLLKVINMAGMIIQSWICYVKDTSLIETTNLHVIYFSKPGPICNSQWREETLMI